MKLFVDLSDCPLELANVRVDRTKVLSVRGLLQAGGYIVLMIAAVNVVMNAIRLLQLISLALHV